MKSKLYAWNFTPLRGSDLLVRRGISNDSIGVIKLNKDKLEFWHLGKRYASTKSFNVLCKAIAKVEKRT